jgi:hypothetical protein
LKTSRAIAYRLGNTLFHSKGAAIEGVRSILYSTPLNTPLQHEPLAVVLDAIRNHPRYEEKLPDESIIDRIVVKKQGDYGRSDRGFVIITNSKEEIDISYRKCFEKNKTSDYEYFSKCARHAIGDVTRAYKLGRFFGNRDNIRPDDVTRKPLTFKEAEVDHAPPNTFKFIVDAYLAHYGYPVTTYDVAAHREMPPEDAARFLEFHNKRAHLRIISAADNRSQKYNK